MTRERNKIRVKTVPDVTQLEQVTKQQILADSMDYDKDNYNPLEGDKEILIPDNRTEVMTIRLTPKENEAIKKIAQQNGLSKSSLLRMLVTRSLKNFEL